MNYASMAAIMAAAYSLESEGERRLILAIVLSAIFQSAWGVVEYLAVLEPRSNGTFFNPNYYGGYLAAVTVWLFGWMAFGRIKSASGSDDKPGFLSFRFPAIISLIILLFLIGGVLVSQSRGAFLALIAGLFFVMTARWGIKTLPGIMVIVLLFLLVPNPLMDRLKNVGETDIYAWSRLDIWKGALAMIADNPMGVGTGMYRFFSPLYAFPVEDSFGRYSQVAKMAHSAWLDIGAELSPLSVLVLLFLGYYLVIGGFRKASRTFDPYAGGAAGALATIMVHGAVDSIQKSPPVDFLAAIFAGILLSRAAGKAGVFKLRLSGRFKILVVALAVASTWLILSPLLGYVFTEKAKSRFAKGDYLSASMWLDGALKASPGNAGIWLQKAGLETYMAMRGEKSEHLASAIEAFSFARELNPMDATYPLKYADLLLDTRFFKTDDEKITSEALNLYNQAIKIEPFNPFYRVRAAELMQKTGDYKGAESQYRKALELEPRFAAAMISFADMLAKLGRKNEAEFYYRAAVAIIQNPRPEPKPSSNYENAMIAVDKAKMDELEKRLSESPGGFSQ